VTTENGIFAVASLVKEKGGNSATNGRWKWLVYIKCNIIVYVLYKYCHHDGEEAA